jgi:hypothetical protein
MARARNIKPAFFRSADLAGLPFEARLLFIGLWTLADRAGRMEDRPKQIKMEVFPADDVDVDAQLDALAGIGMIERYVVDGVRYLCVPSFHKHQNPHHAEKDSVIPDKAGEITGNEYHSKKSAQGAAKPARAAIEAKAKSKPAPLQSGGEKPTEQGPKNFIESSDESHAEASPAEHIEKDGDGVDHEPQHVQRSTSAKVAHKKPSTVLGDDFFLTSASTGYANKLGVNIDTELPAFCNWHLSHGTLMHDWQAAWRSWCDKSKKFAANRDPQLQTFAQRDREAKRNQYTEMVGTANSRAVPAPEVLQ